MKRAHDQTDCAIDDGSSNGFNQLVDGDVLKLVNIA